MLDLEKIVNGLESLTSLSDIQVGNERMMFNAFYKKFFYFRNSHISNKFNKLPNDIQLPLNSCIHVLNNLYNEERGLLNTDLPDVNHPFIKNEVFRKFIYHVREPNIKDPSNPIHLDNQRYIFRNIGLDQNIRKFRSEYGDRIRPLSTLEAIPNIPSTLTIINHNPLFRVQVRELLPQYKRFLIILGSILNTAAKIPDTKTQYILLPLGPHVYLKDMFKLAEKEIKPTSIKVKNDFHYFLMMHWLNFINPFSDQSILLNYPESKWDKTIFVFYYGDYYMFWSLADIVRLNDRNLLYNRLVNQFNSLVLTGMGAEVPDDSTESSLVDISKDTNVKIEGNPDLEEDKQKEIEKEKEEQSKKVVQRSTDKIIELTNSLSKVLEIDTEIKDVPSLNYTVVKVNEEVSNKEELPPEVVTQLIDNEEVQETVDEVATIENTNISVNPEEVVGKLTTKTKDKATKENTDIQVEENIKPYTYISGDLSTITPISEEEQMRQLGSSFIEEIDNETYKLIAKQTNLTNKQKDRLVRLSLAYKDITIGDDSLENIIQSKVNVNVDDNKVDVLDNYLEDKSMEKSSIQTFDTDYMKKLFKRHLAEVAVSFNKQGMFLVGIDEKVTTDELNRLVTYKLSYEDIKGKRHTVKFTLPLVGEDGTCYVNGTKQYFRTQMTNLPICKVSPVRVSLASNYNKTIIERNVGKAHSFLPYLQRLISKINEKEANPIVLEYGVSKDTTIKLPYEYAEISNIYKSITILDNVSSVKYVFTFNYHTRLEYPLFNLTDSNLKYIEQIEKKLDAVFLGMKLSPTNPGLYCFITNNNIIKMVDNNTNVVHSTTFIDMLSSIYNIRLPRLNEWTDIKILDKKFPVIFLLAYRFGLTYILKYLGVPYKVVDSNIRLNTLKLRPSDIVLSFKDKNVIIPRYPIRNSLILSGLNFFNISDYNLEEFDKKDVYYQVLLDKNFKVNYLKGIDDTFDLFIDPMTREVLIQMNEPTNLRDLLIRATDMVSNNYHKEAASMSNFRYRSYERFNGIVYNAMARQFNIFTKKRGAGSSFSLNPQSVFLTIIQDNAMLNAEDINPIHDIKVKTEVTYVGQGGRTSESFVINDRRFPNDGTGILSEATKDSGNVAIAVQTPMNPIVSNLYGLFTYQDKHELDPTQLLSVSNLTMPCTTQDDGSIY